MNGIQVCEVLARRAAREFADRLRDPGFRRFARSSGFRPGRATVLALADEPLSAVLARAGATGGGGRDVPVTVVVYRPDTDTPFSFVDLHTRPAA